MSGEISKNLRDSPLSDVTYVLCEASGDLDGIYATLPLEILRCAQNDKFHIFLSKQRLRKNQSS